MKSFPTFFLTMVLLSAPLAADLAAKILAKAPEIKLNLDSGEDKPVKAHSNLDINAFLNLAKQASQSHPDTKVGDKSAEPVPKVSAIKKTKSAMNLADIAKNRRLNNELLNGLPIVTPFAPKKHEGSGVAEFDKALFSTDNPTHVTQDVEQVSLRQKIQEISDSMRKFKSANLKYLNSIDIEQKNKQLFTEAQEKIKIELENYRHQLDTVKAKAAEVKTEKNKAVLELEDLVNQRGLKLRQIADLTKQNDELNVQYSQMEAQIGKVEAEDKAAELENAKLLERQTSLKKQFDELSQKYNEFHFKKEQTLAVANQNIHEKEDVLGQLGGLSKQIQEEAPLNQQLKDKAVEVDKETALIETEILKFQQESAALDRQLSQLEQMRVAAEQTLAGFQSKKTSHENLKKQVKTAHDQANKKQRALANFEHDIKSKERTCRCSRRQLSKVVSEKQMALNNQAAIKGLIDNIQAVNPTTTNMKLLNNLMEAPTQKAAADPSKLGVFNDPYFQTSGYFKGD